MAACRDDEASLPQGWNRLHRADPKLGGWGERALGLFHLGTGFWLMYLVFAVALNFILNYGLPL